jgi:hypothetical protein
MWDSVTGNSYEAHKLRIPARELDDKDKFIEVLFSLAQGYTESKKI